MREKEQSLINEIIIIIINYEKNSFRNNQPRSNNRFIYKLKLQ